METKTGHILGQNVAAIRTRQNLSKSQFCLMASISRPYLDLVESGSSNITLEKLDSLAESLGVEPWELIHP
ncbi:helix-turn-helix transcriptional regulator [Collinsella sp. BA40]|nr:helix-turn-helix transcriptional regulator [Collinsella sp. D33t1_170424_A12]TXF35884.1 helix-turn-helix transcriptional regulator [Collinsella sp. BA40]